MRVLLTGASGLIGRPLRERLLARGDEVRSVGRSSGDVIWDPLSGPLPADALHEIDAVVHLAGEPVAQRWSAGAKRAIEQSRTLGTANLVAGLREAGSGRPGVLVCASAVGYYGDRGDELLTEQSTPGADWLAQVCVGWEQAAAAAEEFGVRVCSLRTGVVLSPQGGALGTMLPPFKLGVGGPIAGGSQFIPWIGLDDQCDMYLAALDNERWSGPFNATAPEPVTNREFSHALGRALKRPSFAPVPGLAVRALYGEMAQIVTGGQRAVPQRAQGVGFVFKQTELEPTLRALLT